MHSVTSRTSTNTAWGWREQLEGLQSSSCSSVWLLLKISLGVGKIHWMLEWFSTWSRWWAKWHVPAFWWLWKISIKPTGTLRQSWFSTLGIPMEMISKLWFGSIAFFIYTAIVIWLLERRSNNAELTGSFLRQLGIAIYFSFFADSEWLYLFSYLSEWWHDHKLKQSKL